jgi:hypothetical protein
MLLGELRVAQVPSGNYIHPLKELDQTLSEWGDNWNLCRDGVGEWTLETALETLHEWSKLPANTKPLRFCLPSAGWGDLLEDSEQAFSFNHNGWDPQSVPWRKFKTEIEEGFQQALKDLPDRIQEVSNERFWQPVPERREGVMHLDWLVRYQVEREPIAHIAASGSRTSQAVKSAVYQLRDLIGLPRGKRGRPKKKG